jgi:hypothetical protein
MIPSIKENFNQSDGVIEKELNNELCQRQSIYKINKDSNIPYSVSIFDMLDQSFSDTTLNDYFIREIELEINHNKQIIKERRKIDNLNDNISRLHGFYCLKLNL